MRRSLRRWVGVCVGAVLGLAALGVMATGYFEIAGPPQVSDWRVGLGASVWAATAALLGSVGLMARERIEELRELIRNTEQEEI